MIAAIAAVSANGVIGLNNWLPWDIPEELAYFERTVEGGALLVGRPTYESMLEVPVDTFVLTHQAGLPMRPGCHAVGSVEAGLRGALATGKPVFVIGGAEVYRAAWRYCERFYLTRIECVFAGDTRFPDEIDLSAWKIVADARETFVERRSGLPVTCRFMQYAQPVQQVLSLKP